MRLLRIIIEAATNALTAVVPEGLQPLYTHYNGIFISIMHYDASYYADTPIPWVETQGIAFCSRVYRGAHCAA